MKPKPPLRILLGPTASGKERIALAAAAALGGEIVSVDSMKIYRGLDIGTAKPDAAARARVPHHCIDIVDASESFSVAQYRTAAEAAIARIEAAGRIPLLSGGTALYYKALTEGLFDGPSADPALREELEAFARERGEAALHERLAGVDPAAAGRIHPHDRRRVVRALEVAIRTGRPISEQQRQFGRLRSDREIRMVGLSWPRALLHRRIEERVHRMLGQGLVEEARALWQRPGALGVQARAAVGYAELCEHFEGRCAYAEAVERIVQHTRQLAKSQMTWFRKFGCAWVDMEEGVAETRELAVVLAAWERGREGFGPA